jgi:hypothetical protein
LNHFLEHAVPGLQRLSLYPPKGTEPRPGTVYGKWGEELAPLRWDEDPQDLEQLHESLFGECSVTSFGQKCCSHWIQSRSGFNTSHYHPTGTPRLVKTSSRCTAYRSFLTWKPYAFQTSRSSATHTLRTMTRMSTIRMLRVLCPSPWRRSPSHKPTPRPARGYRRASAISSCYRS